MSKINSGLHVLKNLLIMIKQNDMPQVAAIAGYRLLDAMLTIHSTSDDKRTVEKDVWLAVNDILTIFAKSYMDKSKCNLEVNNNRISSSKVLFSDLMYKESAQVLIKIINDNCDDGCKQFFEVINKELSNG